jgi:type I restriction enzyme S subunit
MSSEWKEYRLEEIAMPKRGIIDGPFGSNLPASDYRDSGIPVIRGGNLSLYGRRFQDNGFIYVSETTAKRLERSLCYPGDIIFTKKGTLGQIGLIPENARHSKYLLSSNQMKLTVNEKIADNKFVYLLLSAKEQIEKIQRESEYTGVPKINLSYLKNFSISLPPLPTQRRIAAILTALDDKIELNRRMNDTLEGIAQALWGEWFGRYASGEEELPEGWRWGKLGEEFNVIMGQSPPGESYNHNGNGMVFFQGKTDFGFRFPEIRLFTTEPKRLAKKFNTLLSVRAPVGAVNIAFENCCLGRGLAAIYHKNEFKSYTYYTLKSLKKIFDVFEGEGTVFGSINQENLKNINVIVPDIMTLEEFEEITRPLDDQIFNLETQSRTLKTLRDVLLPRLMRGEVMF